MSTLSPEAGAAIVNHGLYYWHRSLLQELATYGPNNTHALASNTGSQRIDTARDLAQLLDAGMVVPAEPVHDYTLAPWFAVTPLGREWAA